jgi:hypothetical protein
MLGLKEASPLSRWETGQSLPPLPQLFRICAVFKAMPTDLYPDLWRHIVNEMSARERNLMTPKESISNNLAHQI